jgi:hypothetical protein
MGEREAVCETKPSHHSEKHPRGDEPESGRALCHDVNDWLRTRPTNQPQDYARSPDASRAWLPTLEITKASETSQHPSLDATPKELTKYIQNSQNTPNLTFSEMMDKANARVLTFGDYAHDKDGAKDAFISRLHQAKQDGITDVAFEGLPKSESSQQTIDSYFKQRRQWQAQKVNDRNSRNASTSEACEKMGKARSELRAQLSSNGNFPEHSVDKLMDIVDATADAGLRLRPIEPDFPQLQKSIGNLIGKLEDLPESAKGDVLQYLNSPNPSSAQSILSQLKHPASPEEGREFIAALDDARRTSLPKLIAQTKFPLTLGQDGVLNWRDQEWSANIQEILQEPDSRVVVFGGCGHFRDGAPDGAPPVLNSLLEKSGINSVAVHTTGSDFEPDPGPDGSFFTKVTRAQENVMEAADNAEPSLNQTEFTIDFGKGAKEYFIHLPHAKKH